MAEPVLSVEEVVKDYGVPGGPQTRVLHGVDFALAPGEFTALIGPSGSGKSTLLNLIGLLDRPTAGRVRLLGGDTSQLDDDALTRLRGRSIGFIFQFHHLLPAFTAVENVFLPHYAALGRATPAVRQRARALLERVGVAAHADKKSTELSGGQQQRVAVARALMMSPALVLADEPTGNLDTETATQVFEAMRELNRDHGTTFLVVTHDPRIAKRCDRIIELVDGRIQFDRPRGAHQKTILDEDIDLPE